MDLAYASQLWTGQLSADSFKIWGRCGWGILCSAVAEHIGAGRWTFSYARVRRFIVASLVFLRIWSDCAGNAKGVAGLWGA